MMLPQTSTGVSSIGRFQPFRPASFLSLMRLNAGAVSRRVSLLARTPQERDSEVITMEKFENAHKQQQSIDHCRSTESSFEDGVVSTTFSTANLTKPNPPKKITTQKERKRKRKNNTGFYYGLRDDVLYRERRDTAKTLIQPEQLVPRTQRQASESTSPKHSKESSEGSSDLLSNERQARFIPSPTQPPSTKKKKKKRQSVIVPPSPRVKPPRRIKPEQKMGASNTIADETLAELRNMTEEMIAMRKELRAIKEEMLLLQKEGWGSAATEQPRNSKERRQRERPQAQEDLPAEGIDDDSGVIMRDGASELSEHQMESSRETATPETTTQRLGRSRRKEFERIGRDVEKWAVDLLFKQQDRTADGWKEIACNKLMKKKFNRDERTQVYLKWMPDTRDRNDIEPSMLLEDQKNYPCLKCYTTIDAPLHQVCHFLANKETVPLYNDLIVDHADLDELSRTSKITWSKCPKILFVKPRDFVTYCKHRWKRDGTQVLLNQACEHVEKPGIMSEGQGGVCRGFALRGANFISKDPDDPNKTRIAMLSHANPGGLPQWAMNSVVNAVAHVEPFRFFHNINDGVCNYYKNESTLLHSQHNPKYSNKPAGIAHLGFACFWPNGAELKEEEEILTIRQSPESEDTACIKPSDMETGVILEEIRG